MELVLGIIREDILLLILFISVVILLVLYIISVKNLKKLRDSYQKFMIRLGNGENVDEMIKNYIKKVEEVDEKNNQIAQYCINIDNKIKGCSQKIGIVRYNAFKDTGSDLSFALAMLDDKNNGVVLNGIYSREMSNIYAKPVENGKSSYTLSEEEKMAIDKAINSKGIYKIN